MEKGVLRKVHMLALFCMAFVGVLLLQEKPVYAAATPLKVVSVEYYEEQVIVLNNSNSKICFATEAEASKGNWEVIKADTGLFTMIDISWLSTTVENILVFKGADDTTNTQSRVIFNEKPLKLEVSINYANMDTMLPSASIAPLVNIMTSVGNGSTPITFNDLEWRKGTAGQWLSTSSLTVGLLEKYLVKGTYIYFRIRAVDDVVPVTFTGGTADFNAERRLGMAGGIRRYEGIAGLSIGTVYPDGTDGRRFSNEIKVKIAKKPAAMVYGIDGEKFTAEIKYGKEYRVTIGSTGTPSAWVQVTDRAVRTLPLSLVMGSITIDGATTATAFPAMKIEIRDYATSKSASSKITEINLDAQRTMTPTITPGPAPVDAITKSDANIYLTYNGNKNIILEVPLATPELPYEYCVVKSNDTYDVRKAVWSPVTKGTAVKILASKAVDGGTLYVRKKEIKSKAATANSSAVGYALASTYAKEKISYPSTPEIVDKGYTFTKGGYSTAITFTIKLNEKGRPPYENKVTSVKLGTKDIIFTPTAPSTDADGVQTIDVTLDAASLSTLANCYGKAITITYSKGTVDKTSIKLTIQSPAEAGSLTVTNLKGTDVGTTAFKMVSSKAAGNSWVYVITDAEIPNANTVDTVASLTKATANPLITTTMDNVKATTLQYLTVFEVNATGYIVKYNCIKLTDYIK